MRRQGLSEGPRYGRVFNDFKTSSEANEGSKAHATLGGKFEFQMSGTAISSDLRVKFMRRETKNLRDWRKITP